MFYWSRRHLLFLPVLGSLLCAACSGETASTTNQFGYPQSAAGPGGATATAFSTDSATGETTSNSSNSSDSTADSTATSSAGTTETKNTSTLGTGEDSGPSSSSSPFLWDVGSNLDLDNGIPIGCKTKKIDFLFVISGYFKNDPTEEKFNAATPSFVEIITEDFDDFDYHIMVVDADDSWGVEDCTSSCPDLECKIGEPCCPHNQPNGEPCCGIPEYPCDLLDLVDICDSTLGGGVVFPLGNKSSYQPCKIDGGRRYLTKEQSNIDEVFTCIADVGSAGDDRVGDALEAAVAPGINGPGGCNEGFYREDALLMVILVTGTAESSLFGSYEKWYWTLRLSKHNNPRAIIALSLGNNGGDDVPVPCTLDDTTCAFARLFPYNVTVGYKAASFVPGFKKAVAMVEPICAPPSSF